MKAASTERPNPFGKPVYEIVAGFPLRKFGSLQDLELDWWETQTLAKIEAMLPFIDLCSRIASERGIEEKTVYSIALNLNVSSPDHLAIMGAYLAEYQTVKDALLFDKHLPRKLATYAIQNRVNKSWLKDHRDLLAEAFDIYLPDSGEWALPFTRKLPTQTIKAIAEFMMNERSEWQTISLPDREGAAETLEKKLVASAQSESQ